MKSRARNAALACGIVIVLAAIALWKPATRRHHRRSVEEILGVGLPPHAEDLRYWTWWASPDLLLRTTYVRFFATRNDFEVLARGLNLSKDSWLLGAWDGPPEGAPSWWNPRQGRGELAGGGKTLRAGQVRAKYEIGQVFIIISEGFAEK
jgi:hypothetical protein